MSEERIKIDYQFFKDTPRTYRFKAIQEDPRLSFDIYLQKAAFMAGPPKIISVELTFPLGTGGSHE
jgi:hypothetical protein